MRSDFPLNIRRLYLEEKNNYRRLSVYHSFQMRVMMYSSIVFEATCTAVSVLRRPQRKAIGSCLTLQATIYMSNSYLAHERESFLSSVQPLNRRMLIL